jgi:hypothetical protein
MKTSEQINELAAALAKAAMEFPPVPRNCEAKIRGKDDKPGRTYHYADLDDVLSAVRMPLAKNGLVLTFDCRVSEQPFVAFVTARLCHASGQWKESEPLPIPCEGFMSTAQQIGSANTYGKRYTAQNMLGISTEQDDDGATAGGRDDMDTSRRAPKPTCPKCGKSEFVLADREVDGRFFCWKNAEKNKLGCGHKWDAGMTEEASEPTNTNGKSKAKAVAEQHGMKTADELPPLPTEKTAYQKALDEIQKAVQKRDKDYLGKISQAVSKRTEGRRLQSRGRHGAHQRDCDGGRHD